MLKSISLGLLALVLCTGVASAQIFINEFMSDPNGPSTGIYDSNADGLTDSSADEFVEIVNAGPATVDISNWTLEDAVGLRHTFSAGLSLQPGAAIVVFGGGSVATFNTLGGATGVTASTGFLGLNNTVDTITIKDAMGVTVTAYTYANAPSPDNGDGYSVVRDPETPGSAFAPHTTATGSGGLLASPGFMTDGQTPYLPATVASYDYPGNGSDVAIEVEVNGATVNSASGNFDIAPSDTFAFSIVSPNGTLNGNGFAMIASLYTTGMAPSGISLQSNGVLDVWIDPFNLPSFIVVDGLNPTTILVPTVQPGGFNLGPYPVPAALTGASVSAIFQVFANDPSSPFSIGLSDAVALDFL